MENRNTMPEMFDEQPAGVEELTKEDVLMSESELLRGLIDAGREKNSSDFYKRIQIRRNGVLKFEFRIRPVSEEESIACHDRATKFAPRKRGQPKRELETNNSLFRSWMIYTATVDEDRKKTWDNRQAMDAFNVLQGVDLIDAVLLSGEKNRILEEIDEISGYNNEEEETAKN